MELEIRPYYAAQPGSGKSHSIRSLSFLIQFNKELGSNELEEIESIYDDSLKGIYPLKQKITKAGFELSAGGHPVKPIMAPSLTGIRLGKIKPDGQPEKLLEVSDNELSFTDFNYSKFDYSWSDVKTFIKTAFIPLFKGREITNLSLRYNDEYRPLSNKPDWNKSDLLNLKSKYLPRSIIEMPLFWHTHNGFYTQLDNEQCLATLNLSNNPRPEEENKVVMSIEIAHRLDLQIPLTGPVDTILPLLERKFLSLKLAHKNLFGDLISEKMKSVIGLNKRTE